MYGKTLMNQNGAPIRLVVPWKYGFKSIKSIVRIRFVDKQPETSWSISNPQEYGLLFEREPAGRSSALEPGHASGASAAVSVIAHPTQMFNGYGDQVASLYSGMDLRRYY